MMAPHACVGFFGVFACVWLLGGARTALSTESQAPGTTDPGAAEAASAHGSPDQQALLQEAIEQARRESEAAAQRHADAFSRRLDRFQQTIEAQHQRELEAVQNANRTTLMLAAALAAAGLLGLFCLAFFLMRATNRLTDTAMVVPLSHGLGPGHARNALITGDLSVALGNPAQMASTRFVGAIQQLEKRLNELEHTAQHPIPAAAEPSSEQHGPETAASTEKSDLGAGATRDQPGQPDAPGPVADSNPASHTALLLAKGEALLRLDKAADALACFDAVIALDRRNAEAFIKKGSALERLERTDEALACYDSAIAVDQSLTTAYLHKGGVFNRLQRFEEALQCYEQALRIEQKTVES